MVLTHGQNFSSPAVPTPLNRTTGRSRRTCLPTCCGMPTRSSARSWSEIERLGLRDNTIVFIASDNGTEHRFQARRNGRVVQGDLYSLTEAGGNVVLMANSPKLVPGGRTVPLADFSDIYPTICELTGVPLSPQHRPDGRSLAAYLRGQPGARPPRDWILNEYHDVRVVRDARFKLYSDGRLFDANADPAEQHDLARSTDPAAIAAGQRLKQVLASLPADVAHRLSRCAASRRSRFARKLGQNRANRSRN